MPNTIMRTVVSMITKEIMQRRIWIIGFVVASLVVVSTMSPAVVSAQESSSVTLNGTTINIDAGETSAVTTEHQFTVHSAGTGESVLASINGRIWKFPNQELSEITASVNGEPVEPSISEQSGLFNVAVPVETVSAGETVTVTIEYQVSGSSGNLQAPIWVPEYSTSGQETAVHATVTLPNGTTLKSAGFPNPNTAAGNTIEYDLLHVPGFIKANYGGTSTSGVSTDTLYSALGVVLIIGFIAGGLFIDRKTAS